MGGPGELSSALTAPVVGREHELQRIRGFVEGEGTAACLVLSGEAGIGKTTLWESGLDLARQSGYQVLSARASIAEAALTFVALADLVDGIADEDLNSLPVPQRRALEVTLRRADPMGAPHDPLAVSAGFLNALLAVRTRAPVLIAIDDVQWLDAASAGPLTYAARRLHGAARFLLTRRPGNRPELERALFGTGVEQVEIAAMSVGAIGRMLSDQVGVNLSRRALLRVHGGTQGNPLFALELGRLLSERGELGSVEELPLPDLAEDVFRARIEEVGEAVRQVLLAVALSGSVSEVELATFLDPLVIDDAASFGVVVRDGSRVRAAHPMLAAAARKFATTSERKDLHLELASVTSDPILNALHLAVATVRPDVELAAVASNGAHLAADRGRILEAVQLAKHALRLTPASDAERGERILDLARLHLRASQIQKAHTILTLEMSNLPAGRCRALAHLLLHETGTHIGAGDTCAEMALAEAGDEPDVRALALSSRAGYMAIDSVQRIDEAARWAEKAVAAAHLAGAEAEEPARAVLAWTWVLQGQSIDELAGVGLSTPGDAVAHNSIVRALGVRLAFRGEYEEAKVLFGDLLAVADERGELRFVAMMELQLCEVELRAGHVHEAARLVDDLEDFFAFDNTQAGPLIHVARVRALLAALAGDPADAVRWGQAVLDHYPPGTSGAGWDGLEAQRAMGIAALFVRDASGAVEHLHEVWHHTRREQIADPGAFPVAGDLVEALVATERYAEAQDVLEQLRRLSVDQEHPWGLATTMRGESLLRLASADHYLDDAADCLAEAASTYGSLGLHFDQARSLLSLGVVQRRFKKWAAARSSLEQAAGLFEEGGASGWADRAREELSRVSGRRAVTAGKLTPTETRVVRLAASGMSNKEIARELFVSVNTVEGHLSRAYTKLGVRSRSQLVRVLDE